MSFKKRATKSIALALVGVTIATPMLSTASAMEIETNQRDVQELLLSNDLTERQLLIEESKREKFDGNNSYAELYSDGQVKLMKFEFQQLHGMEDKFKLINEEDGVKTEVNGYKGLIKITSKEDGEVILDYFEAMDSLYEKGQQELKETKAPNRPSAWRTQGPDFANLVVTKGTSRDSITAYNPTIKSGKPLSYTKATNDWYSGHTKGYYDNVGNARKSWGTAKSAIGPAAEQAFTTTVATFIAAKKFNIGTAGLKAALAAGVISAAKDITTAVSHGSAYLVHMGAVATNYALLI